METLYTGPKGGKYYINEKGRKVYVKAGNPSKTDTENYKHVAFSISDYEHSGDLEHAINVIKKQFSLAKNIVGTEERDREREWDFKNEYGYEPEEYFYCGSVSFDYPVSKIHDLDNLRL